MSSSALYFIAAAIFLLAALAWGIGGHSIAFAVLALAALMLALGIRERGQAG